MNGLNHVASSSSPLSVAIVLGTRPEGIKCAPVILACRQCPSIRVSVVNTGQHKEMLEQALYPFSIVPDMTLGEMQAVSDISELIGRQIQSLSSHFRKTKPDIVLVQGDTSTALAAALAAYYERAALGHIEAGLRSHDLYNPFPEEGNRKGITALGTLHFAPTELARKTLLQEHVPPERILVTGNTVVDSLLFLAERHPVPAESIVGCPLEGRRLVLITSHRREVWGEEQRHICEAIRTLARRYPSCLFVFPVHKNPVVHNMVHAMLRGIPNILLLPPLGYLDFVSLLRHATLVLTDSGGIQEEAPTFGVPVLVLRSVTERPEAVQAGLARLVGTSAESIIRHSVAILDDPSVHARMSQARNPFGDGHAAERIVQALLDWHAGRPLTTSRPEPDATERHDRTRSPQ